MIAVVMTGAPVHANEEAIVIRVPGIPGPYCAYGVEKRLEELPGVQAVKLHWRDETITAQIAPGAKVTKEHVQRAMEKAIYPYKYTIERP
jgi:mercuric ion binding protein